LSHMSQATTKKFEEEGVEDLVLLPKVTNQGITANLLKRYQRDKIYTNIGPVLVSVNPFRLIKGVCDPENVQEYKGRFRHEVPPNVFALSEEAYAKMKGENENQCVIITGESGAGKTEAAKLIMKYIAAVSGNSQDIAYVKDIIMESNPLLEAFGNAKTLRNNNSSRFGKYFEIQFNRVGDPCGGKITTYLLEKTRVVGRLVGERSFHFFYQLVNGAPPEYKQPLGLTTPDQYRILNCSQCYEVDGMNDTTEYHATMHAMNTLGFTPEDQWAILKIVAGILHLGNIQFGQDDKDHCTYLPGSEQSLAFGASLLDINIEVLKQSLASRTVHSRNSTYLVPNNALQATGALHALLKVIYARVFDYLIAKTNTALLRYSSQASVVIGVLDIYGFEIFNKNGFEQFCINYVNEKLQQFFIELTLKAEQEEYKKEGITWEPIQYFNNKIVCDLIEGKNPVGVFALLDEVCVTMSAVGAEGGIDVKFLDKCTNFCSENKHWWRKGNGFVVKHYAGEVTYDADGFCEKNRDVVYPDLVKALQSSASQFLRERFPEDVSAKQQQRPPSYGFLIRTSAGELMKTLSACSPHYIRCIKPNDTKKPQDWEEKRVEHQVQYLGLLENVRVRRAGFAYRAPFDRFLNRYKKLNTKTWSRGGEWTGDARSGCQLILSETPLGPKQWQLGATKVFIRHPESLFYLEESLERFDYDAAMAIQKAYRKLCAKKIALEQRARAANILLGKKDRRAESQERKFEGDYIRYDQNYGLQNALGPNKSERVLFADQVLKLNRRLRLERRDLILTVDAIYFVMRATKLNQALYKLSARIRIAEITKMALSTLQDNFVVLYTPQADFVFENHRKTEFLSIVMEYYQNQMGKALPVEFTDTINYRTNHGDTRTFTFQQDGSASTFRIKKNARTLTLGIAPGIGKNANTAPQGLARPAATTQFRPQQTAVKPQPVAQPAHQTNVAAQQAAAQQAAAQQAAAQKAAAEQAAAQQAAAAAASASSGGSAPLPPGAVARCKALYTHSGQSATELSFKIDDVIIIYRKDAGGWWEGELNGTRGWVPNNYVKEF